MGEAPYLEELWGAGLKGHEDFWLVVGPKLFPRGVSELITELVYSPYARGSLHLTLTSGLAFRVELDVSAPSASYWRMVCSKCYSRIFQLIPSENNKLKRPVKICECRPCFSSDENWQAVEVGGGYLLDISYEPVLRAYTEAHYSSLLAAAVDAEEARLVLGEIFYGWDDFALSCAKRSRPKVLSP